MATKVIDILNILEKIAPSRIAEDWDNPGLQVGQVYGGIEKIFVSLEAAQRGADLLLTGDVRHHEALEAISAGLALIDGGHFHTEKAALSLFVDHLKNIFLEQNLDVDLEVYREEKEPMRYE